MKKVLHFLCGAKGRPLHTLFNGKEWEEVRLDHRAEVQPSILCHWRELDRLEAGSFDGIWSGFGLNRIPSNETSKLLKDWLRLLKPDGKVVTCVTNVRKLGEMAYKQGWDRPREGENLSPMDWWYGDPGRLGMPLLSGFSSSTLAKAFADVGFTEVEVKVSGPQLILAASRQEREGPPRLAIKEEDINRMMLKRDRLDQAPQMNVTYP